MELLVLGANTADIEAVAQQLDRAGHGVHRCAPIGFRAQPGADCVGSTNPMSCPLVGPIDAAVLIDSGPAIAGLQPTGLGCAVRDHLPLAVILPGEDPVLAAADAMRRRDDAWTNSLRELTGKQELVCESARHDQTLRVHVSADVDQTETASVAQLSSRAYDVVRDQLPTGIHAIGVGVSGTSQF